MINLLFISSSPRVELLRVHFQQTLKMRIEVVEDFDRGLKDVFEKRPVVVCIQEQIAGVTGESVARHIQLLLGNGAPRFILMHEGSAKAKAVPGLFNHLVDLSASFEVVCRDLQLALQATLEGHWEMVYTPIQQEEPEPDGALTASLADQLVDDFIAENSIFNPHTAPPLPGLETYSAEEDLFIEDLPGGPPAEPQGAWGVVEEPPGPVSSAPHASRSAPEVQNPVSPKVQKPISAVSERPARPVQQASVVSTAPVEKTVVDDGMSAPVEELLQAFEENYQKSKRFKRTLGLVSVVLLLALALVWAVQSGRFRKPAAAPVKQQAILAAQKPEVQLAISSAKTVSPPAAIKQDAIPSFVPRSGQDHGFSKQKPGWSRYLHERREYRLFHSGDRLKALQVLAVGNESIPPSELKKVLLELTGSEEYRTNKHEKKGGLILERASVQSRAELLLYRTTAKGPIKAFVIELRP